MSLIKRFGSKILYVKQTNVPTDVLVIDMHETHAIVVAETKSNGRSIIFNKKFNIYLIIVILFLEAITY